MSLRAVVASRRQVLVGLASAITAAWLTAAPSANAAPSSPPASPRRPDVPTPGHTALLGVL